MMNTRVCLGLALCGLLAGMSTGCASAPMVARAQNELPEPFVRPASYGYQPDPHQLIDESLHGTSVNHYNVPADNPYQPVPASWHQHLQGGGAAYGPATANSAPGGACKTCPPHAECPHCQGHPSAGQTCPFCQSSVSDPGAGGLHDPNGLFGRGVQHLRQPYPQHHFTYSYKRPNNLVYPPPQVPGGAIVYPYYTLKGPSDFFRDDGRVKGHNF
jgi:hypothetical protein